MKFTVKYHWFQEVPLVLRAMLLAEQTLFVAGLPDIFATDDPTAPKCTSTRGLV